MPQPRKTPVPLALKMRKKKFTADGGHRSSLPEDILQKYVHLIGPSGIIEELEAALSQLGYDGNIMLVAHSYGALYAALYAARHPTLVKAAVFIDGSSACWFIEDWIKNFVKERRSENKPTVERSGSYY